MTVHEYIIALLVISNLFQAEAYYRYKRENSNLIKREKFLSRCCEVLKVQSEN